MHLNSNIFREILHEYVEGAPLDDCLKKRFIAKWDWHHYIEEHQEAKIAYQKAREYVLENHVEQIVQIADTDENPHRARLRCDVRKWIASKLKPNVYGDRMELNVTNSIDIRAAIEAGRARMRDVSTQDELPQRDLETEIKNQIIETIELKIEGDAGHKPVEPKNADENSDDDIFS
jgi:hypothetical protein